MDEGLGPELPGKVVCSRESDSRRAEASFARIMTIMQTLNSDMKNMNQSIEDLAKAQRDHEEHTDRTYTDNQERINFMNVSILEIRQLTGPGGLSRAHIQRIRRMKRGSIFEDKNDICKFSTDVKMHFSYSIYYCLIGYNFQNNVE